MSDTWAILLAAGESSRMGQLKALLPWRGATLIEHQVASLFEGGVDRIVVVVGHEADRLVPLLKACREARRGALADSGDNLVWSRNPDYLLGKTTSIKTGLSALIDQDASAVLMLNVDQPRSGATIRRLLERHQTLGRSITIPEHGGKGGHPIIVDARLLGELLEIDEETLGVKSVVRRHANDVARVDLGDAEVLWDLNTPEQYRQALDSSVQ